MNIEKINTELLHVFTNHGLARLKERFPDKTILESFEDIFKGRGSLYFMHSNSFGVIQRGKTGDEAVYVFSPDFKIKTVLEKRTLNRKYITRVNKEKKKEIIHNFIIPLAWKINQIAEENIFRSKFIQKLKKKKVKKVKKITKQIIKKEIKTKGRLRKTVKLGIDRILYRPIIANFAFRELLNIQYEKQL